MAVGMSRKSALINKNMVVIQKPPDAKQAVDELRCIQNDFPFSSRLIY